MGTVGSNPLLSAFFCPKFWYKDYELNPEYFGNIERTVMTDNPITDAFKGVAAVGTFGAVAGFLLFLIFAFRPIIFLWAFNGLFNPDLEFSFWNLVYAFFLCGSLSWGSSSRSS
jgi:hypothetical protein